MYLNFIRYLVWFIVLNLVTNFIFPNPIKLWWLIEIVLALIAAIMIDWKEDKK